MRILQVSFHPSGSYLMSGSQDKSLIIFDLLEARPIFNVLGHNDSVNAVKFSPGDNIHLDRHQKSDSKLEIV